MDKITFINGNKIGKEQKEIYFGKYIHGDNKCKADQEEYDPAKRYAIEDIPIESWGLDAETIVNKVFMPCCVLVENYVDNDENCDTLCTRISDLENMLNREIDAYNGLGPNATKKQRQYQDFIIFVLEESLKVLGEKFDSFYRMDEDFDEILI